MQPLPNFLGTQVKAQSSQEVLLAYNCWGFAWEVLYQADNADTKAMTISTADPTSAWRAFTGPGFDLVQSSLSKPKLLEPSKIPQRNAKTENDVVQKCQRCYRLTCIYFVPSRINS